MVEAAYSKRGPKLTPEESKKLTDAALLIAALIIVGGGFAGFFALSR